MTQYIPRDIYVLRGLEQFGIAGDCLINNICNSPIPVADLLVSLKKLEANKLIKLKKTLVWSPSKIKEIPTLADLEQLIAKSRTINPPVVGADGFGWAG